MPQAGGSIPPAPATATEEFVIPWSWHDWWRWLIRERRRHAARRQQVAAHPLPGSMPPPLPAASLSRPRFAQAPPTWMAVDEADWPRVVAWVQGLPSGAPVTVGGIAEAMGCARGQAWHWLNRLETAGVVIVTYEIDARGKPRRRWWRR